MAIGDIARDVVRTAGYPGLAGLILAENLFPPIPSEVILPLAGYYVGEGEMAYAGAVLAATIGSLVGALIIYTVARLGGRPLLLRHGRVLRIHEADLDRADDWFDRFGDRLVLGGRLIPGARSLVSIPAGMSEMPVLRFALFTTLGSAVWNAALVGAGLALGNNFDRVGGILGPAGTAVTVLLVGGIAWWFLLRRRGRAG